MLQSVKTFALCAGLVTSASTGFAQDAVLDFDCNVQGRAAQMVMGIEYARDYGLNSNSSGDITGVFPVGTNIHTSGKVTSGSVGYRFSGTNQFADFSGIGTHERFLVRWTLDRQRNGVWVEVDPFGNTSRYFCGLRGVRRG